MTKSRDMMNQFSTRCKSFNGDDPSPGFTPLTDLHARLLAIPQVLHEPGPDDLREMSKFSEIPNIFGLAAHLLARPWVRDSSTLIADDETAIGPEPVLPIGIEKPLIRALTAQPWVAVSGLMAGESPAPVWLRLLVPQSAAHLALALRMMLWPADEAVRPAAQYQCLVYPEPLRSRGGVLLQEYLIGHWPGAATGLIIGHDDPGLIATMALDAVRRACAAGNRARLRPASATCHEGTDAFAPRDEPLLVEPDGVHHAAWRNPLFSVRGAITRRDWLEAMTALEALSFGDLFDEEGRLAASVAQGYVAIPRPALPESYFFRNVKGKFDES